MAEDKAKLNRRKFIAASVGGVVAAGMTGLYPSLALGQDKEKKSSGKLITRKLGKTSIEIPIVGMGVAGTSNPALLKAAFEQGVRYFDTAANYQYGRNEQMIGNVLPKLAKRSEYTIATKILIPQQRQTITPENAEKQITTMFNGSLKKLKTDYVDVLFVHDCSTPEDYNRPEIYETLKKFKKQGKIKAIGVASHSNMAALIDDVAEKKIYDVFLTSINFTMANDNAFMAAIKKAHDNGIGMVAMKTQAGGANWPNPESRQNYDTTTIAKACLKWVLNQKYIATSIPGYRNFQELEEDFSIASDLALTRDEKAMLESNDIRLGLEYCRQCKTCLASCPQNTDIPTLMRTHMYAAQYADFYLARETLNSIPTQNSLTQCDKCETCVAQCANSVDIPRKLEELKLMYA